MGPRAAGAQRAADDPSPPGPRRGRGGRRRLGDTPGIGPGWSGAPPAAPAGVSGTATEPSMSTSAAGGAGSTAAGCWDPAPCLAAKARAVFFALLFPLGIPFSCLSKQGAARETAMSSHAVKCYKPEERAISPARRLWAEEIHLPRRKCVSSAQRRRTPPPVFLKALVYRARQSDGALDRRSRGRLRSVHRPPQREPPPPCSQPARARRRAMPRKSGTDPRIRSFPGAARA